MSFKLYDSELSFDFTRTTKGVTCIAKHGGTSILCSVSVGEWTGFQSFLSLHVNYFERSYAINRIPSGFIKREGRQRENEILISRIIDRSIRPTIDSSFRFKISVTCVVLSYNKSCSIEPLAITTVSAAIAASGIPSSLVAGLYIGYNNNKWGNSLTNAESTICIAGNYYGLSTIEISGKPTSASTLLDGVHFAAQQIPPIIDYVKNKIAKIKQPSHASPGIESNSISVDGKSIIDAFIKTDTILIKKYRDEFVNKWTDRDLGKYRWSQLIRSILRSHILWTNKRIDGRGLDDIRTISVQKNLFPLHGSCMFTRGKTQVLCVVTVVNTNEAQIFESLDLNDPRKFILHYNFLADEGHNGNPSRRDIGHGNLARNALKSIVPTDKFIRIVSEVIESDGSSSMATVSGAYLALKNSGIDVGQTLAGISIGVIVDGIATKFITDMTELEDQLSDMDFKVSGTNRGITSIQLDLKVQFLPWSVFESALQYGFNQLCKVINTINTIDSQNNTTQSATANPTPMTTNPSVNTVPMQDNITSNSDVKVTNTQVSHEDELPKIDSTKIRIQLDESVVQKLAETNLIDETKKEYEGNISVKGNTIQFTGKNVPSAITKLMTKLLDSPKDLYYGRVAKIIDGNVEIILLTGRKCSMQNGDDDLKIGLFVLIYKGRFGRWTLHSVVR